MNFKCSKCGEDKTFDEIASNSRRGKGEHKKLSYCKECRRKQEYNAVNKTPEVYIRYLVTRLKAKCTHRKIYFELTADQVFSLYQEQNGKCFYTDVELVLRLGKGFNWNRISIDKIIPERGYTIDNIVLCTQKANIVKNNLTLSEMKEWTPGWFSRLEKKGFHETR